MIAGLFLNPGFLFIAVALISVPIIIHLINRMRFKRIRWAAMEFLLKAQKRTRRRLILEQLLLLALRCLLLALVGLLVSRFIGCGDANLGGKPSLHLVLLDDTLSMQDHWKRPEGVKNALDVAKTDILIKKIAKGLAQSKTNDQLIILPLSKIDDPEFKPEVFSRLNDPQKLKELTVYINELQPSMLHVNTLQGVKAAKKIIDQYAESRVTLHLVSDYRHVDWGHTGGEGLAKELLEMAKNNKDLKIRAIDTVDPPRSAQGYPQSRDNVGIVDIRPSTRIVGHKMPVRFTITIANFSGKQVEVRLNARDERLGKELLNVDFHTANPTGDRSRIVLSPSGPTDVFFDYGDIRHDLFFKDREFKPGESRFAHLSIRLTNAQLGALENDGIHADNIRHTVIEVRDKVPILVIDGDPKGREENKDSFFLGRSLISVPGASYNVIYGDEVPGTGGIAVKALEKADLKQYPTIFLLNVPALNPKQLANLENYVKEGGGVGFYMGSQVDANYYNKNLFKDGKGVFPVPLKKGYFPALGEPELPAKDSDTYQLITRDEKFADGRIPIFGAMFEEPKQREPLRNLPIRRYFKVDSAQWKPEPGRVFELATLPNEDNAQVFENSVAEITLGENVKAIVATPELAKYKARLEQRLRELEDKARPGADFKAYHLANQIDILLTDRGNAQAKEADLVELWGNGDAKVQTVLRQLKNLRDQVNFGDPFVITQSYGKGKVVAIMSTAGKDWNDWPGGSAASVLYPMFVWEMQNYLSSPGSDANLTVGATLDLALDGEQFKGTRLKLARRYMKTEHEKPSEPDKETEQFGDEDNNGQIVFKMTKNLKPGLYMSDLFDTNAPDKPIAVYAHAFNVDTAREGQLQRVGSDELNRNLIGQGDPGQIEFVQQNKSDVALVSPVNDFSESPWLFLILLLVLVAEQALAVHLSFHMKNSDTEAMAPAGVKA